MSRSKWLSLLIVCLSLTHISAASARPTRKWSMKELWQKADLVAIGTIQSTADAPFMFDETPKEDTWIGVNSLFDTQAVLKGKFAGQALTLRHFRFYSKDFIGFNGPVFIRFNVSKKNQYLMFLKRMAGGDYEPLTGQLDPHKSFHFLQPYNGGREW